MRIALIELHDARIAAIVIGGGRPVTVVFEHLPVYREREVNRFEIWSYRASLELFDVDNVTIEGAAGESDYVSDAKAIDAETSIEWELFLQRRSVSRVEITFGSGRTAVIRCREARLILSEALRHVEDWAGPL
jgi:hypothetical protein